MTIIARGNTAMTAAALTDFSAAEAAPTVPVAAGRVLTLAGAVFAAANLFQYGVQSGALHLHEATLALSWPVALTVFFVILARLRRSGGEAARRVAGWSRLTIGLMLAGALGLAAASFATGDWGLMRWTSVVSVGLYGAAWAVAWVRTRGFNMMALGLTGLAGAAALVPLIGTADQYLLQAATLAVTALMPGLWLASGRRL